MAAAFVKYWVELHVGEEEGKKISEDLLGVTEVMYVAFHPTSETAWLRERG